MTLNEIEVMCRRIAGKYKNKNHYDDMVQEGVLACLEILECDPGATPESLYSAARRRIFDFYNLDLLPVNVPLSDAARAVVRGKEPKTSNHTDLAVDALRSVVKPEIVSPEDANLCGDDNLQEEEVYRKEIRGVLSRAKTKLSEEESLVIHMRYNLDMTQQEVADYLGKYQRWVSRVETSALEKMKEVVCNNS